jgi:hypothetical protein
MSLTLIRSAAGFALLAAVAAGCGTAAAAHSAPAKPAATAHLHHQAPPMHPVASTPASAPATAPTHTANPIPQGNGGDQDADNNGGPSDGDGNI